MFSPMPGVAQLQNLPATEFFLAQLSANEIRQLAEMVVAFENGDPEHKLAKVQQLYASSQQEEDTFSKFLRVINPVADAYAIAPALPLAATYLLSGVGILAYKSKLEQSGSDYVPNQQAQMNALMMSPTADLYIQLGVWTINNLTTKPDLPVSSTGFPIHQLDEDPYITPVPSAKAHGEQPEYIPMQDMLGQILSQPMPDDILGSDSYITPIPSADLLWQFIAYEPNSEIEQSNRLFISDHELEDHFNRHGSEFKGEYKNPIEYLAGANNVIEYGSKITYEYKGGLREGYVKFMGNKRGPKFEDLIKNRSKKEMGLSKTHKFYEAKFEFVALRPDGTIATYHTKDCTDLFSMLNNNKKDKTIKIGLK